MSVEARFSSVINICFILLAALLSVHNAEAAAATIPCGSGNCAASLQCCNDVTIGSVCYDPTSYSCVSGSDGLVLCGYQDGNPDSACGTTCYDSSAYTCFDGNTLCSTGHQPCGGACYDPSAYECCSGQLAEAGTSSCSSPTQSPTVPPTAQPSSPYALSWPIGDLVVTNEYTYTSSGCISPAIVTGSVVGSCYSYGDGSTTRSFTCNNAVSNQIHFNQCDMTCGNCSVVSTYYPGCFPGVSEQYQCTTLAPPTAGVTYEFSYNDAACTQLNSVSLYYPVCYGQNNHASTSYSCDSTNFYSNSYTNNACANEGTGTYYPSSTPLGQCITLSSTESYYYGCGPLNQ